MNYRILARKYRPKSFNDLVGQEILVEIFRQAFDNNKLAQAYLLTGIRGVGKTTTARIIAKAFNCEKYEKPSFNICNKCKSCISIDNGNNLDVLEVDAASKTGVDNIRELIETVVYSPNENRYKIYIIDEIHMLSIPAFNALLKTLEEPPEHTKFIFATTEMRKIPATIISRCQKFELKRIQKKVQISYLKKICEFENIIFDNISLNQIAYSSEGSMRDALSILDQVATLTNNNVNIKKLNEILGLESYDKYFKILFLCLKSKSIEALEIYDSLINVGVTPIQIISSLLEVCSASSKYNIDNSSNINLELYKKQINEISDFGLTHLIRSWQILIKGYEETRIAPNQIDACLMTILKLCYSSKMPMPEEIIRKLDSTDVSDQRTMNNFNIQNNIKKHDKSNDEQNNISQYSIPKNVDEMLSILINNKEAYLHAQIINNIYISSFKPGKIEIELTKNSDKEFLLNLSNTLERITKIKWDIVECAAHKKETISEREEKLFDNKKKQIAKDPFVEKVLTEFPDAEIKKIK